eukprot:1842366-Rhodomonas_salina.1
MCAVARCCRGGRDEGGGHGGVTVCGSGTEVWATVCGDVVLRCSETVCSDVVRGDGGGGGRAAHAVHERPADRYLLRTAGSIPIGRPATALQSRKLHATPRSQG